MRELSLFTGAGGCLWGSKLLGWRTVGCVECEPWCQKVIRQRQCDGHFDECPIFGLIESFLSEGYARAYKGMADVISAGPPCQPHSNAYFDARGEADPRDKWPDTIRVIREVEPRWLLLENVTGFFESEYGAQVLGEVAACGYDLKWDPISAHELGADHERTRGWIVAHAMRFGSFSLPFESPKHSQDGAKGIRSLYEARNASWGSDYLSLQRLAYPGDIRAVDGLAHWEHRLKALGNGQVPRVVVEAWERSVGMKD